ncbi:MAG: hypothetical protein ACLRT4_04755 [Thomasclavelia sp.]
MSREDKNNIYGKACFEMSNSEYNNYEPAYIFVKDKKDEKEIIVYGVNSSQETMIRYTGHESIEIKLNKDNPMKSRSGTMI